MRSARRLTKCNLDRYALYFHAMLANALERRKNEKNFDELHSKTLALASSAPLLIRARARQR